MALVRPLTRRIVATLSAMAMTVGPWATCHGWQPTTEQRMACCSDNGCPMHGQDRQSEDSQRQTHAEQANHSTHASPLTQAQADQCCLASETDNSSRPADIRVVGVTFVALEGPPTIAPMATLVPHRHWRPFTHFPAATVPRHLLLSVLLI